LHFASRCNKVGISRIKNTKYKTAQRRTGIMDYGTAIGVVHSFVKIIALWLNKISNLIGPGWDMDNR